MRYVTAAVFLLCLPRLGRADDFSLKLTQTGHLDYVFIGNTMADNQGLANGVNCLLLSNAAAITAEMLSVAPELVSATLYISGSLLDDGVDYPPDTEIFAPPSGLDASLPADNATLSQVARAAAAISVEFQPPGAAAPTRVFTNPGASYVTVYNISAGAEAGNVAFFSTPIDVTEIIVKQGKGRLIGDYHVSNLVADVCRGLESVCYAGKCANIHTNGNASFGLLLIFKDLALPQRSITLFEGLTELASRTQSIRLENGSAVSDPASGSLTFYALEGDLSIGRSNPAESCGGDESIVVSSPGKSLCLNDADNPPGNIFNGTINTVPATSVSKPTCTPTEQCCLGPHVCGLAGIDIDRFNISSALSPGVTEIDIDITTGSDRIALANVVLAVDVYRPVLAINSQFRLLGSLAPDTLQVGGEATVSLAISNTGNVAAEGVTLHLPLPAGLQAVTILDAPAQAEVGSTAIDVAAFSVAPGKVQELRLSFITACSLVDQSVTLNAEVAASNVDNFGVQSPPLEVGGPGLNQCLGIDPEGPFDHLNPSRLLRGDGCAAAAAPAPGVGLLTAVWAMVRSRSRGRAAAATCQRRGRALARRRERRLSLLPLGLALWLVPTLGCGQRHSPTPAAPTQRLGSLDGLPGQPCAAPLMVRVTQPDGPAFCIDRFEASAGPGAPGNLQQSQDDTVLAPDGSTQAAATVGLGLPPSRNVSWYQAAAMCSNAGKRLCTVAEWERACRGPANTAYPYGNAASDALCNGFFQYFSPNPAPTGSFNHCVSAAGAFDLSGNVEEWLATPVARQPGTVTLNDRALHGGSYRSNPDALACVGLEFHSPPNQPAADRGFRCCKDL